MPIIYGAAGEVLANVGSKIADANNAKMRTTGWGDVYVMPLGHGPSGLNTEGTYFTATNPTWGTGIAMGIQTTFSATANALATIVNTASAGGKSIHMDFIKLICTAAGLTTTSSDLGVILDVVNRYSSGGTLLVANPSNTGVTTSSIASIRFGAVTAAAANTPRQLTRDKIKTQATPCWTVGDEVIINFGAGDTPAGSTNGAATVMLPVPCGPACIAPGHSAVVHMWNAANATTAPSWEVQFAWWER